MFSSKPHDFVRSAARVALLVLVILVALGPPAGGSDDTDELENLVRRWLEMRRERHVAEAQWREQEALLGGELRMLEQRRERRIAAIEIQNQELERLREEVATESAERERYEEILAILDAPLRAAEARLKSWPSRLPPFIVQPLSKSFARLPSIDGPATLETIAERIQTVIVLHSQLEQFNASVHAGKMILEDPEGREREMDVLFLGLAGSLAVSADDRSAARGRLTGSGWSWTWESSLGAAVRSAWACYRKEEPAAFVDIPLRVVEEER